MASYGHWLYDIVRKPQEVRAKIDAAATHAIGQDSHSA
jgi:hypothetical protein